MSRKLTVVIPAYNEEKSLKVFFPKVLNHCHDKAYRLIIVNDGSNDKTLDFLKSFLLEFPESFKIINHKVNRGYGGALKSGIKESLTDYVITIDADGQHYLRDIDNLLSKIVLTNSDLIVGSRKGLASSSKFKCLLCINVNVITSLKDIVFGVKCRYCLTNFVS